MAFGKGLPAMTFRVQIYHHDEDGNRSLTDHPQDISATTHKAAAATNEASQP